jgi:Fur family peroxide stress response transcriptional regulator
MAISPLSPTGGTRLAELLQQLREHGCRLTPQRMAIVQAVLSSSEHPTAEQIHAQVQAQFPMTSLATVYNTLGLLKEVGALLEINLGHGSSRYDGINPQAHLHLICTHCQAILDADLPEAQAFVRSLSQATGFQVTGQRFDLFGICPQCQRSGI